MEQLVEKYADLLEGSVDLYTHANPDPIHRRHDDFGLVEAARAAGVRAVVHRHHFSATTERSRIVRDFTGFPILGAVLLNDSVGGLNPTAVELALQMGAAWVSLPTLSAQAFRSNIDRIPERFRGPLSIGPGALRVVDDAGALLPDVKEILELVREKNVALNLGYVGPDEYLAVAREAAAMGIDKMVVTNPGLSDTVFAELFAIPGTYVEITAYGQHPDGPSNGQGAGVDYWLDMLARVGIERVVLSSDGGMADAPSTPELHAWALDQLRAADVNDADLRTLVRDNPTRLVGAFL